MNFVREGKRLARRPFAVAGGWGTRGPGVVWLAPQWPCLGREALRAALRTIDLASGARVGCINVKSMKQGEGLLGTRRFRVAGQWGSAEDGGDF